MPRHADLSPVFPVDPSADPETLILSREDHRVLNEAVLRLPPRYRIVLVLRDMGGTDTNLVAKFSSIEPGTVRIRLHRARLMAAEGIRATARAVAAKALSAKEGAETLEGVSEGFC